MPTFALNLFCRSDGLVDASFPDVPIAVAQGRDKSEAYDKAVEALEAALDRYVRAGFDLPVARSKGELMVRVGEPEPLEA